eukprot:19862_4
MDSFSFATRTSNAQKSLVIVLVVSRFVDDLMDSYSSVFIQSIMIGFEVFLSSCTIVAIRSLFRWTICVVSATFPS